MSNAKEELMKKLKDFKSNLGFAELLMLDSFKKNNDLEAVLDNLTEEDKERMAEMALQLIKEFEKLQIEE